MPSTTSQRTLALLTAEDWDRPAVNGLTVGELVGHLDRHAAVDGGRIRARRADRDTGQSSTDHIESTREAITAGSRQSPAEAADEFARVSKVLINHLAGLDAQGLAAQSRFGSIVADIRFLLIVRVFELWTHDNDLRRAVGLDRVEPDPDRLWMMTQCGDAGRRTESAATICGSC